MESPPKRMTRARAAARATDSAVKTTRIITAAARAKTLASTTNAKMTTSTKRKERADEVDRGDVDELEEDTEPAKKSTRGRPRKAAGTETQAVSARSMESARPSKRLATMSSKDDIAQVKVPRGRPKKKSEEAIEDVDVKASNQQTKSVRSRTATAKSAQKSTQSVVRKAVKFQEPDKENDGLATAKGSSSSGGIRARPARRAQSTSTRATKVNPTGTTRSSVKPLSPKKVTQIPISRMDSSEDELAGGDTPLKRMQKQPIKPHSDLSISPRKPEVQALPEDKEGNTLTTNNAILNPPGFGAATLGSPARRPPASPFKDSMKSPARKMGPVQLPTSMMKCTNTGMNQDAISPSKSLLQSAAKRPQSPIKGLLFGSTSQPHQPACSLKSSGLRSPAKRAVPGYKPRSASPQNQDPGSTADTPRMKPIMSSPTAGSSDRLSQKLLDVSIPQEGDDENVFTGPIASLRFPGRLSAVLPRDAELAEITEVSNISCAEGLKDVLSEQQVLGQDPADQFATPERANHVQQNSEDGHVSPADSLSTPSNTEEECQSGLNTPANPVYQLRAKDLDPCYDMSCESEDDLSPTKGIVTSSASFRSSPSKSRRTTMGLSALSEQLGSWSPADPIAQHFEPEGSAIPFGEDSVGAHSEDDCESFHENGVTAVTPVAIFFENEISARVSTSKSDTYETSPACPGNPVFEDIITDEDIELANEADEMSLKEADQVGNDIHDQSFSDDISESSQEYADENQMPVDPGFAPTALVTQTLTTPTRAAPKLFNTTTKVPLKPADYSTPSPLKKRSFSASRVALRRPSSALRNFSTVSQQSAERDAMEGASEDATGSKPNTPMRSDILSNMGTPAHTPRQNTNTELLRGAVVFVDVHTSEGADASGIFVDLLNQMGARCVKTWNWSPDGGLSSSKCGITHVVFKDGGKRTMERVREANGVVHCVGVTWVLDCERENQWLDEAPYYIDRGFVPRGGARRRKSMEPKALANMNGTLVNSSSRKASISHDVQVMPKTPMNRRQSTVWMHTPSDQGDDVEDDNDYDWSKFLMLTPVPKTPAPEAVARYAADIPTTPSDGGADLSEEELLMRTCPPKSAKHRQFGTDIVETGVSKSITYEDVAVGVLGRDKDEHVRMRLMAARRKSLQFAPKVGSPLARTWK